jgi:hypothetical protein
MNFQPSQSNVSGVFFFISQRRKQRIMTELFSQKTQEELKKSGGLYFN